MSAKVASVSGRYLRSESVTDQGSRCHTAPYNAVTYTSICAYTSPWARKETVGTRPSITSSNKTRYRCFSSSFPRQSNVSWTKRTYSRGWVDPPFLSTTSSSVSLSRNISSSHLDVVSAFSNWPMRPV